ncbi:MAG TPA: hypothetical protein VJ792_05170, partial [Candidatus Nitrosotalea sp.]|nr:hypothetical protein [Candidatus Nitrosotalea sp.]
GVTPAYPVAGDIQMDMLPVRAAGTVTHPVAYVDNNSTGPVYGTVSLVSDGKVVYTSPGVLFGTGQTQVVLDWKVPTTEGTRDYQVHAVANIYGKSFGTGIGPLTTFQSVQTVALSSSAGLNSISQSNQTVANPAVLYSSFKNDGTMRFQVTAPDGTCVIGGSDKCLVTKSTFGLRGNFKIVTVGDQTYLVRYSGPDSPLERFSITSTDPIVGKWNVQIVSQESLVPQAEAANDVFLKVKYTEASMTPVTLDSR